MTTDRDADRFGPTMPEPPAAPNSAKGPTRAMVRNLVRTEVIPHVADYDRREELPQRLWQVVADHGLLAPFLPPDLGGHGMDLVRLTALHEEIGRGCSSLRSLLTAHSMVCQAVWRWGGDEQRARWLPWLATGRCTAGFALTEPGGGGAQARVTGTTATRTPTGWSLRGHKKWITGGTLATIFLVFAGTDQGVTAFLVPAGAPGVTVTAQRGLLGVRASMTAEVVFAGVEVSEDALLGPVGWAEPTVMSSALTLGRLSVAAGCVGMLQACLDASTAHARRTGHGRPPLSDHQLIRRMISDMVTATVAARTLCERAATLADAGDPQTVGATWIAKYFASTAAARAATDAVQIHGAEGCLDGHPVARLYRDAKIMEIIEGSTEMQQLHIAVEGHREPTS
ncbi:MAG: acyl-CoA dehydrogenase family protein [Pseudonocardiaceae bacterium]